MNESEASAAGAPQPSDVDLLTMAAAANRSLHAAIGARVVGQADAVDLMLIALLARGHALLVGVPGLAKTLLVASLAEALDLPKTALEGLTVEVETEELKETFQKVRKGPPPPPPPKGKSFDVDVD